MAAMTATHAVVSSLVFLDLETTCLVDRHVPRNLVRITELAMVGVTRHHFISSFDGVPRVKNKLTLCINPRADITQEAASITGLDCDSLQSLPEFSRTTAQQIQDFLCQLPEPICLLAHNGKKFDFPILARELLNVRAALPPLTLCVDTLLAAKAVVSRHLGLMTTCLGEPTPKTDVEEAWDLAMSCLNDLDDDSEDSEEEPDVIDDPTNFLCTPPRPFKRSRVALDRDTGTFWHALNFNERTPSPSNSSQAHRSTTAARRRLNFGSSTTPPRVQTASGGPSSIRYGLKDLHQMFLRLPPPVSHTAEEDCLSLMRVCYAMGKDFLCWVDGNATLFSGIKPLN